MTCCRCNAAERGTRTRYGKTITDSYCVECRRTLTREAVRRFHQRERESLGRGDGWKPTPWNKGQKLPQWFGRAVSEGKRGRA